MLSGLEDVRARTDATRRAWIADTRGIPRDPGAA